MSCSAAHADNTASKDMIHLHGSASVSVCLSICLSHSLIVTMSVGIQSMTLPCLYKMPHTHMH